MIRLFTIIPLFFSWLASSQSNSYELVLDDDNIWVEKFDSSNTNDNRFNENNTIFKVGNAFLYEFTHLTKVGDTLYYKLNESDNWNFVDSQSEDKSTIKAVLITVSNGLGNLGKMIPDYNQTVISYTYGNEIPFSSSGVIENEKNVWMHPPRDKYFRILELNPFPYIQAPYEIGHSWTWQLKIGDFWGDARWKNWTGTITNSYTYQITGKEVIQTELGPLECFVIESIAKSRIGQTRLKSHFNTSYGFINLEYTNIDQSTTWLKLIGHTTNER